MLIARLIGILVIIIMPKKAAEKLENFELKPVPFKAILIPYSKILFHVFIK